MCGYNVSVLHGCEAEIEVHTASQKHDNYVCAAEGQGKHGSFFQNSCGDNAIRAECLGFSVKQKLPLSVSDHHAGLFFCPTVVV